ncbi:hypothetical protein KORDIASMS9_01788 [Kordia sp. SMS9]|uniref:hypothetical protein n=1 Tax=Kordia sp. SMS9 TaxID=2282170 RepID=UPI000E0DBBD5|nr:hypothetical protein [Kordia sp. SMS9]AXG69565.1 hypothetical protein KORDIASMS9_01788 [Kordia sp. SMS9]
MKRKSLKSLGLNKSRISSLTSQSLIAGDDTTVPTSSLATAGNTGTPTSTELTDIACSVACTGPISEAPSNYPGGCKDK